MDKFAIWAELEAIPEKEKEVVEFLKSAQKLAEEEPGTSAWYALKIAPLRYLIFDTFPDEQARNAHLSGQVAKSLVDRDLELFASEPMIHRLDIVAAKTPGQAAARAGA